MAIETNKAVALDQAMADLWSEGHKLDMVIRMLCDMDDINLQGRGLEGLRNLLGGVLDAMDVAEEAYKATRIPDEAQAEYRRRCQAS